MTAFESLSDFLADLWMRVRAAAANGFPQERPGGSDASAESATSKNSWMAGLTNKSPGRMTRNGLGNLEIGAGKTRVDE